MTTKRRITIDADKSAELDKVLGFDEPAGSLAPLDSTKADKIAKQDGWAHALDSAGIKKLHTLEDKIRKTAEDAVKSHVRYKMKLGGLMNEARDLFPGDLEFGKWRAEFAREFAPGVAPRTLNSMMQIAREFKDAPAAIEAMGWTTARELVNAPQAVMNKVYDLLESGEEVTAKDVKGMKADAADSSQPDGADSPATIEGELIPADRMEATAPAKDKSKPKVLTEDEMAQIIRDESDPAERVYKFKEFGRNSVTLAWAVIGLLAPNAGEEYSRFIVEYAIDTTYTGLNQADCDYADRHIAPIWDID